MTALMEATFVAPEIDFLTLLPIIVVLGTAVLSVLVAAFLPRRARWVTQVGITVAGLIGGLVSVAFLWPDASRAAGTFTPTGATGAAGGAQAPLIAIWLDRPTLFLQGTIVLLALVSVLVMAERSRGDSAFAPSAAAIPGSEYEIQARAAGVTISEAFSLVLFAVGGMMAFVAAGDLLTMFVALEVFSLPLYILCGIAARRRLISQEASLKYFVLGAFSSAIFLFGAAWIFTVTGTISIPQLAQQLAVSDQAVSALIVVPVVLLLVGLLFKVGAVPFHSWTPDVYEGAPTAVTGFMAACTKIAAVGALMRVLFGLSASGAIWQPIIAAVATLSMVVGVLGAIQQTSIKRMLAYSSIAHAGFILTALTVVSPTSTAAVLFYVFAYGTTTVATFACVSLVRERAASGDVTGEAGSLAQWQGLAQRAPMVSVALVVFMLATAGIPLTSGFAGKYAVFAAAVAAGYGWLAVVGVLASAVAAFFYVRVIVAMYSSERSESDDVVPAVSVAGGRPLTSAVVALGFIATIVLGVFPSALLTVLEDAMTQSWVMQLASAGR